MIHGIEHALSRNETTQPRKILTWLALSAEEIAQLPEQEVTIEDIVRSAVHYAHERCSCNTGRCSLDGYIRDDDDDALSIETECKNNACGVVMADAITLETHTRITKELRTYGLSILMPPFADTQPNSALMVLFQSVDHSL